MVRGDAHMEMVRGDGTGRCAHGKAHIEMCPYKWACTPTLCTSTRGDVRVEMYTNGMQCRFIWGARVGSTHGDTDEDTDGAGLHIGIVLKGQLETLEVLGPGLALGLRY